MIKVNFKEPNTPEWQAWKAKCAAETQKLIADVAQGKAPKIKRLYSKMKAELVAAFHGKCVFCETSVDRMQGDVEHFRPKGRIDDSNGKRIPKHKGYYWLAYDLDNLMPACERCNQPSPRNGVTYGKRNFFPVNGTRAFGPLDDLALEDPVFIHPVKEDPASHFKLHSNGYLEGVTDRGKEMIRVLGLNEGELPAARKEVYEDIESKITDFLVGAIDRRDEKRARAFQFLVRHRSGIAVHAMAGRTAIDEREDLFLALEELQSVLKSVGGR